MDFLEWIVTIIILTEFLLGNCANVFILLVNSINSIKRRKISSADRIITALAIFRIGLLWATVMNWYSTVFIAHTYSAQIGVLGRITWVLSNHFNNWLGTILSIFYLFKIANFSNLLFLHLKRKIENVLLVIFWGSFLFLIAYLGVVDINKTTWMSVHEGNMTLKSKPKNISSFASIPLFSLINITPFSISLTCVLLLIYSLGKHVRNMKFHGKGCQDPSAMAHIKAVQTMVSFLLLFATYSVCVIVSGWSLLNEQIFLLCIVIGTFYPAGHSCILIWGNRKLKQALQLFLRQMRC
ncbi:taste receptor type 2 member 120-like [Psammomys obesus]|uniref:taste receptor type 2 member 120-like n=1 Tax=Psammomys obesus TaxID=48139 RepID=UPI00245357AA|nr:taste receptor type 2 member 120-like [Psammomys obesus]